MAPWLHIGAALLLAAAATVVLLFFLYATARPGPLEGTLPPDSGQAGIQPSPPANFSSFLQPCKALPCAPGLVCDRTAGVCLRPDGATCDTYAQCLTGSHCSGICTPGPTGGALDYCPCSPGFVCEPLSPRGPTLVCRGKVGVPCTENEQCAGGVCNLGFGVCAGGFPLGLPCLSGSQCGSGNCLLGFCQPAGLSQGEPGAVCSPFGGNPLCSGTLTCVGGTCQEGSTALGAACSSGGPYCRAPLLCQSSASSSVPVFSCLFPSPDPLSCGKCLPGYTCRAGTCVPLPGSACVSTCAGFCSGSSGGVFSILQTEAVLDGMPAAFQGPSGSGPARKIAWIPTEKNGVVNFTLYLLTEEPLGGLYVTDGTISPTSGVTLSPWKNVIPSRQTTSQGNFLLLDLAALGGNAAVSFLQTSGSQSNVVLYSIFNSGGSFSTIPVGGYSQSPNFLGTQFMVGAGPGATPQPLYFSTFSLSAQGDVALQAGQTVYMVPPGGVGGRSLFQPLPLLPPVEIFSFYQGSGAAAGNYAYTTAEGKNLLAAGGLALPPLSNVQDFSIGPASGGAATVAALTSGASGPILTLDGFPLGIQADSSMKMLSWKNLVLTYSPGMCY